MTTRARGLRVGDSPASRLELQSGNPQTTTGDRGGQGQYVQNVFPPNVENRVLQAPDEFYNVDDFFDSYLYELRRQNNPPVVAGGDGNNAAAAAAAVNPDFDLFDGLNVNVQTDDSGDREVSTQGNRQTGGRKKRQSQANKVAQQRYRERKKQRYMEMEKAVEDMKAELTYMEALKKRNSALEAMNSQLQTQMIAKESEIEQLKANMDAQADASLVKKADAFDEGASLSGNEKQPEKKGCVVCNVLPKDLSGIDFKTGFEDQIQALKEYMNERGISLSCSPKDADIDEDSIRELADRVGRSCQLCQAAIRSEGVQVLNLINGNMKKWKEKGGDPRWAQVLEDIQLTEAQKRDMLLLRSSHLEKMKQIYSERQQLNLDAISKMLPHSSDEPENDMTIDGRMNSMSSGAYLPLARRNALLNEILDKVKQNLRKEQRAMMDLNCFTISNIMTPLQGARYMVGVYPMHCDALALSNALARSETSIASSKGNNEEGSGEKI